MPAAPFRRDDNSSLEGRTADAVTLCFGNALNRVPHAELVQRDWSLDPSGSEAPVVRRDLAEQGPILLQREARRRRAHRLARVRAS